ncbi:MAG: ATP-binding protein [Acidimicrobiia bacterium]
MNEPSTDRVLLPTELPHAALLEQLLRSTDELFTVVRMDVDPPTVVAASAAVQRFVQRPTVGLPYGHGRPEVVQQVMVGSARLALERGAHEFTGQYRSGDVDLAVTLRSTPLPTAAGRYVLVRIFDHAPSTSRGVDTAVLETLLAASSAERRRLAQELHDDAVQVLASLAIRLGALGRDTDPTLAAELGNDTRQLMTRLRATLVDLDPGTLGAGAVGQAIVERVRDEADTAGVVLDVSDAIGADAPADITEALYRIGTEVVLNAIRHAKPGRVRIRLGRHDGGWGLHIRDDGVGFEPADTPAGRYGLVSIRARARRHGGSVGITSGSGQGTTVRVWLPDAPRRPADAPEPTGDTFAVATAAVERMEGELQQIWTHSPIAQITCGPDGAVQRANPAAEALLGRNQTVLAGTAARVLSAPATRAAFIDALEAVQEGLADDRTGAVSIERPDGVQATMRYRLRALRDGLEPPWSTLLTLLPADDR